MARNQANGDTAGFAEQAREQLRALRVEHRLLNERIAELSQQRRNTEIRINLLETVLADEEAAAPGRPSPRTLATEKDTATLADVDDVIVLMGERGEPMHYRAISEELTNRGYRIEGKDPAAALLSRFSKDRRVRLTAPGTYALRKSRGEVTSPQRNSLTAVDAAAEILRRVGHPLHFREITQRALQSDLWSSGAVNPEDSIKGALNLEMRKAGERSRFRREGPGRFALAKWNTDRPG